MERIDKTQTFYPLQVPSLPEPEPSKTPTRAWFCRILRHCLAPLRPNSSPGTSCLATIVLVPPGQKPFALRSPSHYLSAYGADARRVNAGCQPLVPGYYRACPSGTKPFALRSPRIILALMGLMPAVSMPGVSPRAWLQSCCPSGTKPFALRSPSHFLSANGVSTLSFIHNSVFGRKRSQASNDRLAALRHLAASSSYHPFTAPERSPAMK